MVMEENKPTSALKQSYLDAAARLDITKVFVVGVLSFALFGYLYSCGRGAGPVWILVLVPFVGSVWFGRPGYHLPIAKYLIAGLFTACAGFFWLGVGDATPRRLDVSIVLLVAGLSSYAIGARLGARVTLPADQ